MEPSYDRIGTRYSTTRQTDPKIAEQLFTKLKGASQILNIGAGTGSYEPEGVALVALEPSSEMISQRNQGSHPVVKGYAEHLPFEEKSFSHTMTILSMHHWTNKELAYKEIKRVTTESFVAVTWDPGSQPFWLTRDYFPEIFETDRSIFPKLEELNKHFDNIEVTRLMIPENCGDGFLAAFWKRPEAYLDDKIRQAISTFSKLNNLSKGLDALKRDLKSGAWAEKNKDILSASSMDAGYVIISAAI